MNDVVFQFAFVRRQYAKLKSTHHARYAPIRAHHLNTSPVIVGEGSKPDFLQQRKFNIGFKSRC